jgi:hypothetical protein
MYKALCVAVVVAGLLAFTGRTSSAAPAPFTSPVIVAKGKVLNQNAPISTTTIFTPNQTGLYRLSVYGTVTTAGDQTSNSYWSYNPAWTDDSGVAQTQASGILIASVDDRAVGSFVLNNVGNIGVALVLEAKAGTDISYSMTQVGPPDGSAYSLYYTLERLE